MHKIRIGENEKNQRVDRYLKKYLNAAPLSMIYKIIRKDLKINGKRTKPEYLLEFGDEIFLYLGEDEINAFRKSHTESLKKCGIGKVNIAFEDDNLIIVNKPAGLLVHGDKKEKKKTLTNQVRQYLYARGEIEWSNDSIFMPSAANRIDRNTTGLVIFCKNAEAMRNMNKMIHLSMIDKYYLTILCGELKNPISLEAALFRDSERNISFIKDIDDKRDEDDVNSKTVKTFVEPVKAYADFTLAKVRLDTGRTHQIRAHLKSAGYPLIGDRKYGNARINEHMAEKYGLASQLLHAYELKFNKCIGTLIYLEDTTVIADPPAKFKTVANDLSLM